MGTWIEIRCEARLQDCMSGKNSGPMSMATDTKAGIADALRLLALSARSTGWKKARGGWVCPKCEAILHPAPMRPDRVEPGAYICDDSWVEA